MMIAANIISLTILFAVPLLLVALGGMFSEHAANDHHQNFHHSFHKPQKLEYYDT